MLLVIYEVLLILFQSNLQDCTCTVSMYRYSIHMRSLVITVKTQWRRESLLSDNSFCSSIHSKVLIVVCMQGLAMNVHRLAMHGLAAHGLVVHGMATPADDSSIHLYKVYIVMYVGTLTTGHICLCISTVHAYICGTHASVLCIGEG